MTDDGFDPRNASSADDPIASRLAAFRDETAAALTDVRAIQATIAELLAMPDLGVVTIQLDSRGGIESVNIDREGRGRLGAEGLNYEINMAIARAQRDAAADRIPSADELRRPLDGIDVDSLSVESLMDLAFGSIDLDPNWAPAEPHVYWNRSRTVGVTLDASGVRSVDCDPGWIDGASAHVVMVELAAASAEAFAEADREKEGLHRG